ncbi:hypothetical protein Nepgr_013865 [Nepenthes gracilis]|uniref:Centromere/kinetochore protein zw10 homolog n=1 Tax=Nepenthes gracilis TaxID=150966 RepID=A0AAD3SJN9_NEPGR|nr:hypothetical protein Nepgr_013865 [Nepenthes gracilis]
MDVLFKSINVRDLLPSHDLEDSSPLSAPDLRLLIDRLDAHSHQIKSKVQRYIQSHYSDFSDLLSLSAASVSQSNALSSQLDAVLSFLSHHPIYDEIKNTLSEIRVTAAELETKKAQASIVRIIVKLTEKLDSVKESVKGGRLVEAAKTIRDLKVALRVDMEEERENEIVVYELLRKEWLDCFEEIQELLVKFMENVVRYEPEFSRIRVVRCCSVSRINGIELHMVLEAMDVLGILDYGLAKIADLFTKHVISPAVNLAAPILFIVESNDDLDQKSEAILKIVPCLASKIEDMNGETLFSRMTEVVKFIYEFVCLRNGSWMRCFGRLTWPRMSDLIISNFLCKVVPDDASKLADFQRIRSISAEFETVLKETMFISASDENDERLSKFADNVEVHFVLRKKTEILAKARKLILQSDFNLPQELKNKKPGVSNDRDMDRVVDLLFLSEKCVVSEAASQLMKLVHHTLQDVCLSSPRVALELYHAARDALLLYEGVIPVKLERQLDSINQVAVFVHNDCLYLSQEILGLSFEYRPHFSSVIKDRAVFLDMAPRLQLLAAEILQRHVQIVIFNLKEAVDGADGFQNTHQMQQYESAKLSIDQVVFILEKVRLIWEPLLMPSVYKRSMCTVLESVFSRISQDILLLDDIAAEETLQLQRLIQLLLENLSSLLESLNAIKVRQTSDENGTRPLDERIPSLRKVRKLADFLDMPLKSITQSWESGELFSCGFVLSEVVDFIKAVFTDSPLRKDCLWRIQSTNF